MKKIRLIGFLFFLLISFNQYSGKLENALAAAGENRKELEKVLDFYKTNHEDSLKQKAAVFLIENLPYRYSCKSIPGYEKAFDSVSINPRMDIFKKLFNNIPKNRTFDIYEMSPDINQIKSSFLINTIDFSFEAWNKIPNNKRATFEEFCQYILPYKTNDEPIEEGTRQKLAKKYSWALKNLLAGASLRTVVDSVVAEFNFTIINDIYEYYPQKLSVNQVEKIKFGKCTDGVNYLVHVFRSLGLVSASDLVTHWGNHPSSGHSWLYVKYGNEEYSTDVGGKIDLKALFCEESVPKVLRESYLFNEKNLFAPLTHDVTADYSVTTDITIPNIFDASHSQPVLCVFDYNKEWDPITYGYNKKKSFSFNNIGVNVLYTAASQEENELLPVNYPFFLDKNKNTHILKPSESKVNSVVLTRKCKLSTPRNREKVMQLRSSLNGGIFQGANKSDFSDGETLYKIANFYSPHPKKTVLQANKKYKYVRFYSNGNKTSLASLAFYGADNKQLNGVVIHKNIIGPKNRKNAFDNDPLTYTTGQDFSLGLEFTKPTVIKAIEFQIQNDMNHIVVGNEYELFYWNKQWETLGVQVAKDTLLKYPKVPDNALFWLRNNTGGREEQVFIIDKNRKQFWPGSDNY